LKVDLPSNVLAWNYTILLSESLDEACKVYYNVTHKGRLKMTLSVRLNKEDSDLIKKYADFYDMSVSELVRESVFDRIEDEFDLKAYNSAIAEFRADPVTYSLEEVERELGLR